MNNTAIENPIQATTQFRAQNQFQAPTEFQTPTQRQTPTYPPAAPATTPAAVWTPGETSRRGETGIDQMRYWVGGALTAVIAALTGLVGLTLAHGILHVPVVLASGSTLTPVHVAVYAAAAAGIAVLAAGLFDGMLHVAPRPLTYYSWLAAIVTLLATLLPFTTQATLHSQIALAATNLAVGLIIALLVPVAASNARR